MPEKELSGKVAIVTGAAAGIGKGIARVLAQRGAGIVVADIDERKARDTAGEIEKLDVPVHAIEVDVRNASVVEQMVSRVREMLGRIDVLVNNAGISGFSPFWELSEEEWDRVFDVNTKGTFLCTKYVAPVMIQQKSGKIVNIASISGMVTKFVNQSHYCASKAAVISFTKSAALELAPFHINVNAVSPGVTVTEQTRELLEDEKGKLEILHRIPLGRLGKPGGIGEIVAFLASARSDFMTGSVVVADGGMIAG
jgi:NAD(P)-dependent dehydrogenase (short-subunit alcohol dehydrogenase family)